MSRIIHCSQQSDLWFAARLGRITGSRLGDLMAPPTERASKRSGLPYPAGSEALAKENYRRELIVERLYRKYVNHFVTRAMEDGIERERFGRMFYEAETSQVVELVGFALHYEWDWFGASADGLCGDDGGLELKSPTNFVHDGYVQNRDTLVEEYKWQCLGCLTCFPERQWWDLASFSPHAPDSIKLIKFRFHRSDWAETIVAIETEAQAMHESVEKEVSRRGFPTTVFDIMPSGKGEGNSDLPRDELGAVDLSALADQLLGEAIP